ncbi:hypothetical protein LUZ60_003898 [Juncus effusus]|nr:hypothetical protein LUZ60_003898 [Juncus effusus]
MVMLSVGVIFKDTLFPSGCIDDNETMCDQPRVEVVFFYVSLYILAVGAGGTKPNISTLGADQFDDYNRYERKLKSSFFNWWFFGSFLGALLSAIMVYLQENKGWGIGYGIPTAGLFVALVVFFAGVPFYRHKKTKSQSPISEIFGVFKKAFVNRRIKISNGSSEMTLYELEPKDYITTSKRQLLHTSCFKYLDKAASKESAKPCTVTQVEASKLFLRMFLIWLTALIPFTLLAQTNTLFIKQGSTLDRSLGPNFEIPAAALACLIVVTICICVPLYDKLFVPLIRCQTGNPRGITMLQRIGIGFFLLVVDIIVAYVTELKRMEVVQRHGLNNAHEKVPMSIFWLVPQYILVGISDVFSAIGLLEFFYDQSPEGMQSLGATFFTSGYGVGNFLNGVFVTIVDKLTRRHGGKSWIGKNLNDSHLDYYYVFLIVLSTINFIFFVWGARRYQYKREVEEMEENIKEVQMGGEVIEGNYNC